MLKYNILIALRSFKKNKISFLINLIGLSVGLACALLIYLWVNDEIKVNKFHEKDDHLYQVFQNYSFPDKIATWKITPILLANALENDFPEVEVATCISSEEESPIGVISYGEKQLISQGIYANENFFNVFSFPVIHGDQQKILNDKTSIAISERLAKKLFDRTDDVVGKTIDWTRNQRKKSFMISGVYKTPPANSTIQFDFVWNIGLLIDLDEYAGRWNGSYAKTFAVLKPETDLKNLNNRLSHFMKDKTKNGEKSQLFAQQFSKNYLHGNFENGKSAGGRIAYVKLFSIIAIFILLIACINFMNLSTAQASTKMKEVGVKKTMGANRKSLIIQFLSESTIMVLLSMGIALFLVKFLLPQFNLITDKSLDVVFDVEFVTILLLVLGITSLTSGFYPAFYLSGFKPTMILKGKRIISFGEEWVRKGLVVFQFALSVIFIVGVVIINQQMKYIQDKDIGYNRENVLSFKTPSFRNNETFLAEVEKIQGVESAGNMFGEILSGSITQGGYSWKGNEDDKNYSFKSPIIGPNIIETLGMQITAGRSHSKTHNDDYTKIIINEKARKMMELDDPIGMNIAYGDTLRQIIGVVNDFNYGSIHHKVEPLIFRFSTRGNNILVSVKTESEAATIVALEKVFKKFHPSYPFEFSFLDDDYQALYEADSRVAILSKYFCGLTIIISCLGLFGLAMFVVEQRKKEISIRKVLGSSNVRVLKLLTTDFTKTILVAIFIALPLSYLIIQNWLENFAYTIDLKIWFFIWPAILVLVIAWLTIGVQIVKAININPAVNLKE